MHRRVAIVFLLFISHCLQAQYKVTFRITRLPSYHPSNSTIYLAGTFNNWNPAQKEAYFEKDTQSGYTLSLLMPKGTYEYKLTRGAWDKVECTQNGIAIDNRRVEILSDTLFDIEVMAWADHFHYEAKKHTANKNVHILDTAFYIPQLKRHRRIWIYLPEGYATSQKKYPVLYLQDGQNVFDEATSYAGEWGVDETLDTLEKTIGQMIVVAIDNGGEKRINEYSPFDMKQYGKGEGDKYVNFLVKTLRPYLVKRYRILKWGRHHYIAGSSMGGLISFYALLKYPKKFGGAGVFSPAFWITPQLKEWIPSKAKKIKGKIYFYAGMREGTRTVSEMLQVFELMTKYSEAKMTAVIRSEGQHNEAAWRHEFPLFYQWLWHPL
ncbi:MAG: alpha/beta hydrolase [Flavisolibacter sp.]|nr:alpha/beta hydrolase [Flavisolibacter sp.]